MADSTAIPPKKSPGKAVSVFLAPTILIGTGIATMEDRGWYSSYDAYECIQRNYPDFHSNVEDYLLFMPAAAVYGLNLAGVKGKNNFVDRSLMFVVSFTLAGLGSNFIKSAAKVSRPDGSDDRSFPSTHTALAFVSATFLHEEYKDRSIWYSIAGYSAATATGVLRMLNNEHWMSDVLVGAGLGILTTKAVYWIDPLLRKRQNSRPGKQGADNLSFIPYVAPEHYGVFLRYTIR
jgi:membrane-associated phospholipid phosphatase